MTAMIIGNSRCCNARLIVSDETLVVLNLCQSLESELTSKHSDSCFLCLALNSADVTILPFDWLRPALSFDYFLWKLEGAPN